MTNDTVGRDGRAVRELALHDRRPRPWSPGSSGSPRCAGTARTWLWLEGRPGDGGRATLVRLRPGGAPEDVSPPGVNVRTRVHEYGGAAFLAAGDLVVVSDFATGRLLRVAVRPVGDSDHPGRPVPVRRHGAGSRAGPDPGRPRGSLGSRRGGQHARLDPARRRGGRGPGRDRGPRRGQRLRLVAPARARRDAPGVAPLGPPEPALGRGGVRGRPRRGGRQARHAAGRGRRRVHLDLPAALGAGRVARRGVRARRVDRPAPLGRRSAGAPDRRDRGRVRRPGLGLRALHARGRRRRVGRGDRPRRRA